MMSDTHCPNCETGKMTPFYEVKNAPVHSVLLLRDRETAVNFAAHDIVLGYCPACGFISNTVFKEEAQDYSAEYEATQGFSPTFNKFHQKLAEDLITKYDLHNKHIVEIGCGMGEFLDMICKLGNNTGTGFDPAYRLERSLVGESSNIEYIADYYSEAYTHVKADFFCCKMTLEHISNTAEFVGMVRRAVGDSADTAVFFQVPNAHYVFGDTAFWDIYYEHCSYFTLGSIARLFRHVGFDIVDLWTDYDDQYLMITARPGNGQNPSLPQENDLAEIESNIHLFHQQVPKSIQQWRRIIDESVANGRKIVLWGGGSKGVSFLTALNISLDEIEYVVDINPNKENTYMAGTGQQIILPHFLKSYQSDIVIIMNPIYQNEIQQDLAAMQLFPELLTL